jgi:hypothetical protein
MKENVGKSTDLSTLVLAYYLMYYKYSNKEEVKQYIKTNKLKKYYNCDDPDESFIDSFPSMELNYAFYEIQHIEEMKKFGMKNEFIDIPMVYKHVLKRVQSSVHLDIIYPWISNIHDFRWALSMILSRSFIINFEQYSSLEDLNARMSKMDKFEKKNIEINKYMSNKVGCPCMIAYFDLCSHGQPKNKYLVESDNVRINTVPNYFILKTSKQVHIGQEFVYSYRAVPNNLILNNNFGFVIKRNIFNDAFLPIKDDPLALDKFNICKELNCVEQSIKEPKDVPNPRYKYLSLYSLEDSIINYGRVKYLNEEFDKKNIIKMIANDKIISVQNELRMDILFQYC